MKLLSSIKKNSKIPTKSPIDSIIGGGVDKGCITQFYGPPGSGKTNIALNLVVNCAINGKKAVFVDTEGGLSIERVKQISGSDFSIIASNIIVFEPTNFTEQDEVLQQINKMIISGEQVDLVILDSAVALYRVGDGESSQLNQELGRQMNRLLNMARKHDLAVVITNHVYSRFDGEGLIEPVGGTILKYRSKIMVEIVKGTIGAERYAILKRHRSLPEGLRVKFRIVDEGLK